MVKVQLESFCNQPLRRFSAGLSDKQLLQPTVDALELGSDRELQRSLSGLVAHMLCMMNSDGELKSAEIHSTYCPLVFVN